MSAFDGSWDGEWNGRWLGTQALPPGFATGTAGLLINGQGSIVGIGRVDGAAVLVIDGAATATDNSDHGATQVVVLDTIYWATLVANKPANAPRVVTFGSIDGKLVTKAANDEAPGKIVALRPLTSLVSAVNQAQASRVVLLDAYHVRSRVKAAGEDKVVSFPALGQQVAAVQPAALNAIRSIDTTARIVAAVNG
jgi:hypothetical protein